MAKNDSLPEKKHGGPVSKNKLYQKASSYSMEAIDTLVRHMRSPNSSISMGAAKTLLNKALPDLKAVEVSGDERAPLKVVLRMDHESLGLPDRSGTVST